jgi:hypothetical protein
VTGAIIRLESGPGAQLCPAQIRVLRKKLRGANQSVTYSNADNPVTPCPMMSVCMSCVPSYV